MRLNKSQGVSIIFLLVIFLLGLLKVFYINPVTALEEQPTTANVTIKGYLSELIVEYYPIDFSDGVGLAPGTDDNPKQNIHGYINITTEPGNNVVYNLSMNATTMNDTIGHFIPVNEIKFNSNCNATMTELSYNLQFICQEIPVSGNTTVYFYLDVPVGQYNNTYFGDIWIYAHSLKASEDTNNRTWIGLNNTTAIIETVYEIVWDLKPIDFATRVPDEKANATVNMGWPTNITVTPNTNVFVDLYINGTHLFNLDDPTHYIMVGNITYSNDTTMDAGGNPDPNTYPHGLKTLNLDFIHTNNIVERDGIQYEVGGDFIGWGLISNSSFRYSWWNITIPLIPGGNYGGDLRTKAVDAGWDPNV